MATSWCVAEPYHDSPVADAFSSLDTTISISGELITTSRISRVFRVTIQNQRFYVKCYFTGGKNLRRWIGRSRVQAEWENLYFFQKLGIPTAPIVAYGKKTISGIYCKGAIVTAEVTDTMDLATLHHLDHPLLKDHRWVANVSHQLADYTRRLHRHHFCHVDLKWRNILVTIKDEPQLFFIDCPSGRIKRGPTARKEFLKDLACLDKIAKKQLSKTQRLRFFKWYKRRPSLTSGDKKKIDQIVTYFGVKD